MIRDKIQIEFHYITLCFTFEPQNNTEFVSKSLDKVTEFTKKLFCKDSYRHLRDFEHPEVIGNGANNNGDFVFTSLFLHVTDQSGQ